MPIFGLGLWIWRAIIFLFHYIFEIEAICLRDSWLSFCPNSGVTFYSVGDFFWNIKVISEMVSQCLILQIFPVQFDFCSWILCWHLCLQNFYLLCFPADLVFLFLIFISSIRFHFSSVYVEMHGSSFCLGMWKACFPEQLTKKVIFLPINLFGYVVKDVVANYD